MSRLTVENIEVQGIGPVDLSVPPASCYVLSGASGTGKSLLLRAIADVIPHAGRCYLDELSAEDMDPPAWRRRVGLLPAESQWWAATVGEHFPEMDPKLLARLGFQDEVKNWSVARLSTGEKQRLSLLRVLANEPDCLLLDEPTASLDAANIRTVEDIIDDYRQRHQASVLWVSHDAEQTRRMADRVFTLSDGKIREGAS